VAATYWKGLQAHRKSYHRRCDQQKRLLMVGVLDDAIGLPMVNRHAQRPTPGRLDSRTVVCELGDVSEIGDQWVGNITQPALLPRRIPGSKATVAEN